MKKIMIIDNDQLFLNSLAEYINQHYPRLEILAFDNALQGLAHITPDLDLLLLDMEMPELDVGKLLAYATGKGLDCRRIIILSSRDADYLHKCFPMGQCLAVLNKHEARQQAVLDMIFEALHKKAEHC